MSLAAARLFSVRDLRVSRTIWRVFRIAIFKSRSATCKLPSATFEHPRVPDENRMRFFLQLLKSLTVSFETVRTFLVHSVPNF